MRWPTPSCSRPTTSVIGNIICRLGFSSRANCRNSCTARCWSIWYRFFIATLSFFLAEKLPSVIMTGVESRYFLRINGHPLRDPGSHRIPPQPSAEKRQAGDGSQRDCHLQGATARTTIARCSFLHRNTLSWRLAFGLGSSDLDPKLGGKKWLLRKLKSVPVSYTHLT